MTRASDTAKLLGAGGSILGSLDIGGGQIGGKNIIINGGMQISQRSASVTGLGASSGYFTLDRFDMTTGNTAGRYTASQSAVTDLEGFSNALKIDCTTADTSVAAGEFFIIQNHNEGLNLQQLKASSTSTRAFTLSFYAKSNASRAIASEVLLTNGTNKHISKLHTIGTSWARYTMTVPAASSTQIDNDNSNEMQLNFWIHGGTTYTGGTLNTASLAATTGANRAAGIGSIFASTNNTLEITGVQMEVGSVATPFEHRSVGEELALCQRYFEKTYAQGTDPATSTGVGGIQYRYGNSATTAANYGQHHTRFAVYKRAAPTVVIFSTDGTSAHVTAEGGASGNKNVEVTHSGEGGVSINTTEVTDQNTFHFTADTEL